MKNFYIKNYGCQMNVYDSQRMADILRNMGYVSNSSIEKADIIILNTCHIREKASEKLYSELGRLNKLKKQKLKDEKKDIKIAVAGCVAQSDGKEIINRAPWVDMVFGPQNYHNLSKFIEKSCEKKNIKIIDTNFPVEVKFDFLPEEFYERGISSFVTIQEGCDKFCNFCVVPYTRGVEYFRTKDEIFFETEKLVKKGSKEIILLGQNVNAWKGKNNSGKEIGLGYLINELSKIVGLERIRYTTSHPLDMDDELMETHSTNPILMPYLHLPIQSGSDKILKLMNRKHTASDYKRIIDKIRTHCPDIALSSDFIVGYPGETDTDFEETISLIKDVKFSSSFSFKYSVRPGTPAAIQKNQIDENVKSERLFYLQSLLNSQHGDYNKNFIGKTLEVLVSKKVKNQMTGKSSYFQTVYFDGDEKLNGKLVNLEIIDSSRNSLTGKFLNIKEN